MKTSTAYALWHGPLKEGHGHFKVESGAVGGEYSFPTRFENAKGTNPEELVGAAHAACYSMAFSATLEKNGYHPHHVETTAKVLLEKVGEGFEITTIELIMEADVPDIDEAKFMELANAAKEGCPISKLFKGAQIKLTAQLLQPA